MLVLACIATLFAALLRRHIPRASPCRHATTRPTAHTPSATPLLLLITFGWLLQPVCAMGSTATAASHELLRSMGVADAITAFTTVFGLAALHHHLSSVGAEELSSVGAEASTYVGATTTATTLPPRRELAARAAEARRDRRTPRSQAHAQLCARQREAGRRLAAVSTCTWHVLSFAFRLRRRTSCRATALLRVTLCHHPLCAAFVAKLRALAARRRDALQLLRRPPRPIPYDVGYDDSTGSFSFRDRYGAVSHRHPAFAATAGTTPAYDADGSVVPPVSPPPDSPVVLCPEQTGAWCYLNTETLEAQWFPPDGSTPLVSRRFPTAPPVSEHPPPRLPPQMGLNNLAFTGWMAIYRDATNEVLLLHQQTGAVRYAPWICLRTRDGRVYFANLVTRETRWLPPHLWMRGWVSRVSSSCGTATSRLAPSDMADIAPFQLSDAICDDPRLLPCDTRRPLHPSLACRRVEGGAPYLYEMSHGVPQYHPEPWDDQSSYPLDGNYVHWPRACTPDRSAEREAFGATVGRSYPLAGSYGLITLAAADAADAAEASWRDTPPEHVAYLAAHRAKIEATRGNWAGPTKVEDPRDVYLRYNTVVGASRLTYLPGRMTWEENLAHFAAMEEERERERLEAEEEAERERQQAALDRLSPLARRLAEANIDEGISFDDAVQEAIDQLEYLEEAAAHAARDAHAYVGIADSATSDLGPRSAQTSATPSGLRLPPLLSRSHVAGWNTRYQAALDEAEYHEAWLEHREAAVDASRITLDSFITPRYDTPTVPAVECPLLPPLLSPHAAVIRAAGIIQRAWFIYVRRWSPRPYSEENYMGGPFPHTGQRLEDPELPAPLAPPPFRFLLRRPADGSATCRALQPFVRPSTVPPHALPPLTARSYSLSTAPAVAPGLGLLELADG